MDTRDHPSFSPLFKRDKKKGNNDGARTAEFNGCYFALPPVDCCPLVGCHSTWFAFYFFSNPFSPFFFSRGFVSYLVGGSGKKKTADFNERIRYCGFCYRYFSHSLPGLYRFWLEREMIRLVSTDRHQFFNGKSTWNILEKRWIEFRTKGNHH